MTYSWFGAAGPHTPNDGSSKEQNGGNRVDDHHGNKTTLDGLDVVAVVHCVEINSGEYS